MIIRVNQVYESTWSNSEDKPQLEDKSLLREDFYSDDDTIYHIVLSCDHENYHNEPHEVDTLDGRGEHTTYTSYHVECDDCGEPLDIEPDFDEPDDYDPDR